MYKNVRSRRITGSMDKKTIVEASAKIFFALLGLFALVIARAFFFAWLLMVMVGNAFHAGIGDAPIGFWASLSISIFLSMFVSGVSFKQTKS